MLLVPVLKSILQNCLWSCHSTDWLRTFSLLESFGGAPKKYRYENLINQAAKWTKQVKSSEPAEGSAQVQWNRGKNLFLKAFLLIF